MGWVAIRYEKGTTMPKPNDEQPKVEKSMPGGGLQEEIEGVQVKVTGHKQWQEDYTLSDMQVVYRRTNPKSWDDMIKWLEKYGESDNELTPGETIALTQDLRSLKQSHISFTDNPEKAFSEAHKHRKQNWERHKGTEYPQKLPHAHAFPQEEISPPSSS